MAGPYSIPITIGVVGHLDAIISREQEVQISSFFRDLASHFPRSPLVLFSSLADGADRIVAKLFLDLRQSDEGLIKRMELFVPLPFPVEDYKKDFDKDSADEFDQLTGSAGRCFFLGYDNLSGGRPEQYLKAGKFVADSSVILLALWDGEKGKRGGTADIVRHKIFGDDENVAESTFEYDGTVFVIPCRRKNSLTTSEPESTPLSLSLVLSDPAIRETLERTEEINSGLSVKNEPEFTVSQSRIYDSDENLSSQQKSVRRWYSLFDSRSVRFRSDDIRISLILFLFGFLFILALEVYSNLSPSTLMLGLVLLSIVIAITIYFYSRSKQHHKKYLLNRTLAEALRIQFYWSLVGINRNVSEFFLRIHRKDFTWVKHLLSAIYGLTYELKECSSYQISQLTELWVKRQASFFRSSILRMRQHMAFFNLISNASFLLAFALLLSVFFLGDYYKQKSYHNDLLVVIGILLGTFALIKAYMQLKGYEQLMNQYELMSVIYARAESKIHETEDYDLTEDRRREYLKELFFVIGKEALIENGSWYLIFKEKEPEIEGI